MPKKSSSGRSGSQRQRTRAQKSVELVRPTSEENTSEAAEEKQQVKESVATATATPEAPELETETPKPESKPKRVSTVTPKPAGAPKSEPKAIELEAAPARAGSASARIAAKRQAQRVQRSVSLITPEHFAYVRRDLLFIGILAVVMVGAIVTLYFTLGR